MLQWPRATVVGMPPCARTMPAARLLAPSPARPRSITMTRPAPCDRAKYDAQPPIVPAPTTTTSARSAAISHRYSKGRVMDFGLTDEQEMVVRTVRDFVERELYPLEDEVERSGLVPVEVGRAIQRKVKALGFYAPNMPAELGGGGLDRVTLTLLERELGRASMALSVYWGRPSEILGACSGEQKERYLVPCITGQKIDALAMSEPGAGSDVRGMSCSARRDGADWVINGTKHFISHADVADFIIVFAASGEDA